jgi:hypothetical protein
MMIWNHVKSNNFNIHEYEIFPNKVWLILIIFMWLTQDLRIGYKCLISHFSPSNVDIIYSNFYMSFLNVYYITLCRLLKKHLILNEVKNWQLCYFGVVTLTVAHYITNSPKTQFFLHQALHYSQIYNITLNHDYKFKIIIV